MWKFLIDLWNKFFSKEVVTHPYKILAILPNTINVANIALVGRGPARGSVGATLWGNKYLLKPTTCDMSLFTGWNPGEPLSQYQCSVNPLVRNSTGIQARGNQIGVIVDSNSIPLNLSDHSDIANIVVGLNFDVREKPFVNGGVRSTVTLKVPFIYHFGSGIPHIIMYYMFSDINTGQKFWFGMPIVDPRGAEGKYDRVMWDQGTGIPIVNGMAGYTSFAKKTLNIATSTFSQNRTYVFEIGKKEMSNALQKLKSQYPQLNLSLDPVNYELRHASISTEVSCKNGGGSLGWSASNWKVELVQ